MPWTVVLIIVVVAVAIGPIFWLRPSPRQKQLAKLRALALGKSIHVRLAPRASFGEQFALDKDKKELACYGLAWTDSEKKSIKQQQLTMNWSLTKKTLNHEIHFADHWDWIKKPKYPLKNSEQLRQFLHDLPSTVLFCQSTDQAVELGWLEKGGETEIEQLNQLLVSLKTIALTTGAATSVGAAS